MRPSESQGVRRGRLLHGLFWGGVALAPLALLILLFGQSTGALRVAVTLAVLTIVMLAISIALKPSVDLIRVDIEERILDEVEQIRMRARDEVATAARNTHRVLSEKIHQLVETIEALRGQIEELRARPIPPIPAEPPPIPAPIPAEPPPMAPAVPLAPPPAGIGVVHRTETVHVTRRTTTVDAGDDERRGTVYGSRAAVEGEWRERRDDRDRGDDHRDREERRQGRVDRWREPAWDAVAAGDRWASVHADDDGRELRMGERQSSVRSDDRGTQFRMEDRWAALRRDDSRYDVPPLDEPPLDEPHVHEARFDDPADSRRRQRHPDDEPDWKATFRSLSRRNSSAPSFPALPAAPGESPSRYLDDHDEREPVRSRGRERERERERGGDPEWGGDREWGSVRHNRDTTSGRDHVDDRHDRDVRDRGWRDGERHERDPYDGDRRGYDRDRDHHHDRDRDRADRRHYDSDHASDHHRDRDVGYGPDRDHRGGGRHGHDREPDWSAGHGRGEYGPPRPRPPHPSEYDR